MLNHATLALMLLLPADTPAPPAGTIEAPPQETSWTENWAVSISTGRSFYDSRPNDPTSNSMWQLSHRQSELRLSHQGTPLVFGVAVHRIAYPASPDIYAVGAGLLFGARHPLLSRFHAELDTTVGLQIPRHYVFMHGDPLFPGTSPNDSTSYYIEEGSPELYARLSAGVALRAASWLDIPVRLTLHMHPVGESHFLGGASVGVRCLLP